MITGTASVLAGAIGSIRRIAGAAQAALGEFRGAGGGLRGVAAGARAAASKLLPEAALDARREIEGLRVATAGKLNAMIGDLHLEISRACARAAATRAPPSASSPPPSSAGSICKKPRWSAISPLKFANWNATRWPTSAGSGRARRVLRSRPKSP